MSIHTKISIIISSLWLFTVPQSTLSKEMSLFLYHNYMPYGEELLARTREANELDEADKSDAEGLYYYSRVDKERYRQRSVLEEQERMAQMNATNAEVATGGKPAEKTEEEKSKEAEFQVQPSETFKQAVSGLPQGLQVIVNAYTENFQKQVSSSIDITRSISQAPVSDVLRQEWECVKKRPACQWFPDFGLECMYDCLTKSSQWVNRYSVLIREVVLNLCDPIGSTFETAYENMEKDPQGVRFSTFLATIKADKNELEMASVFGANSLLNLALTGITTPMMPLGYISKKMSTILKDNVPTPIDTVQKGYHPACNPGMMANTIFPLARALVMNPALLDIALPGFSLLDVIMKYVPGDHQDHFSGLLDVFTAMTEVSCGLVYTSDTGSKLNCDELGAFPRPGTKIRIVSAMVNEQWKSFCRGAPPPGAPPPGAPPQGAPAAS